MKKKLLLLLCITIFCTSFTMINADSASDLQKKLNSLNKQIQNVQTEMKNLKKESANYASQINELDGTLNVLNLELEKVTAQLGGVEAQLSATKKELDKATADANAHRDLLDKRIKVMYQQGSVGYLNVLLSATSFSDLISRIDMVNKIIANDAVILDEMKAYEATIEKKKSDLQAQKNEIASLKASLDSKTKSIETTISAKENKMTEIQKDMKEMERLEDQLLATSKKLEKDIQALQSKEAYSGGIMAFPVPGYKVGSRRFGVQMHPITKVRKMHSGVDIGAKTGSKIVAANDGKVIVSGWSTGGYGNYIIVDHGGQISTLYAHNSKLLVGVGDTVKRGQTIALAGSTGLSTGPHLHFEVRVNGKPVDPMKYIAAKG